jgi:hypothetical protein
MIDGDTAHPSISSLTRFSFAPAIVLHTIAQLFNRIVSMPIAEHLRAEPADGRLTEI